jgi:hypothetical protein
MIYIDLNNVASVTVFCNHHHCTVGYQPSVDAEGIFDLTHFSCPGLAQEMARLPEQTMLAVVDDATEDCRVSWVVAIDSMSAAQELLMRTMLATYEENLKSMPPCTCSSMPHAVNCKNRFWKLTNGIPMRPGEMP